MKIYMKQALKNVHLFAPVVPLVIQVKKVPIATQQDCYTYIHTYIHTYKQFLIRRFSKMIKAPK